MSTRITDIETFIPENLNGHCWHLSNPHMKLPDGITAFPDFTCCWCGRRSIAQKPIKEPPVGHGRCYISLEQENYYLFDGNDVVCPKEPITPNGLLPGGYVQLCKSETPRPEPAKPEFYDSGGRNNENLYPRLKPNLKSRWPDYTDGSYGDWNLVAEIRRRFKGK